MKTTSVILFLFLHTAISAQTKMIRHKSHGGTNTNFLKECKSSESSIHYSNFGMAPQYRVRNSNLDSLILTPDKKIVMVTSETCFFRDYGSDENTESSLWREGKDTVPNHPMFSPTMDTDTIREILAKKYFFANPASSVVIVGFEEGEKDQKIRERQEQKEAKASSRGKLGNRFNIMILLFVRLVENICDCDLGGGR
jgi:hypothetical protein